MTDMNTIVEYAAALATISAACGIIIRAVTRDVVRDVADARRDTADVKHTLKNQIMRIDQIEHLRTSDVERIVKLESAVQSFDRAVERLERGQDKLSDMIADRFDVLAESVREIRNVTPRP